MVSTWRPSKCKRCNVPRSDTVAISKNGYCAACAVAVVVEAVTSMHTRTGTHYDRHRTRRDRMSDGGKARGVGGNRRSAADQPTASTSTPPQP